ncbi:MAG: hypothetical protein WA441_12170 [Methyloceanibacter sp.]
MDERLSDHDRLRPPWEDPSSRHMINLIRLLNELSPWLVTLLVVAAAEVYRVDLHQVAYALPEPGGSSIRRHLIAYAKQVRHSGLPWRSAWQAQPPQDTSII